MLRDIIKELVQEVLKEELFGGQSVKKKRFVSQATKEKLRKSQKERWKKVKAKPTT